LSDDGFPIAIQLVGRSFDEATLFQAAAGFERIGGWDSRHPPLPGAWSSID